MKMFVPRPGLIHGSWLWFLIGRFISFMCRKINGPTRRVEANFLGGDGPRLRLLADPLGLGKHGDLFGLKKKAPGA